MRSLTNNSCNAGEYGSFSRVSRGGDLDLWIEGDDQPQTQALQNKRVQLCNELFELMGEQKVDVLVSCRADRDRDPFLLSIYQTAVEIFRSSDRA